MPVTPAIEWNGPRNDEPGDLIERVQLLESQVESLYGWIEEIGLALEEHSSHLQFPDMQFFMVPRPPDVDMAYYKLRQMQKDRVRPLIPKWIKQLGTSSPEYLQLWDFIRKKARVYESGLEQYIKICITRKEFEVRGNIRPEERKPIVEHLFHIKKIDIYSVRQTSKGMRINLGVEEGMEHRYGMALDGGLTQLLWEAFMEPSQGTISTERTEDNSLIYHLEAHRRLQKK